jgi:uncharacterized protein YndB with AHSA1/START domain
MATVEVERILDAPPETVFERYTDHAGWSSWAGIGTVRLARSGAPTPNGVGAVREFDKARGLQEQVLEFEPPRRMVYTVVRGGFPITGHRGEVTFEPHPRGTRLVWRASFGSKIPFTARPMAAFITRMFDMLLSRFERRGLRPRA